MTVADTILATQAASLEAYYKCDETAGTTLADASGNGRDLTLSGVANTDYTLGQTGQSGLAAQFHGLAGYASRTDSVLGDTPTELTIFCVVKGPAGQGACRVVALSSTASNTPQISLSVEPEGSISRAQYKNDINGTECLLDAGVTYDDQWHSVAFRLHSTEGFALILDGTVIATEADPEVGTTSLDRTAIGALVRASVGSHFAGSIQHVAFWSGPLTDSELLAIHDDAMAPADSVTVAYSRANQRSGESADISLSGTYSADAADTVQVRVLLASDDSVVLDWADVDAALVDDTWSGSISVPTGGPYYAEARLVNAADEVLATATGSDTFVVGVVIPCIGQSNTDGRGTNNQVYTGTAPAWVIRESGTIDETLSDPWSDDATGGSWGPLLANLLDAHFGGTVPLIFVVSAAGGTGLTSADPDWLPPSGASWSAANSLVESLDLNGVEIVLWLQGERDASLSVSAADYEAAEKTLATAVAAWPGSPSLISTLIGHNAGAAAGLDAIRAAKIANWDDGSTLAGANPIDVDLSDESGDTLHFKTDAELALLAGRIWIALENAAYSGVNGRGPQLVSATATDTSVALTFDKDLDTSDTTYTASAFAVDNDDSTAVTISAASRTGAREVTLTCSGAIDGSAPTVTFGSQNTAAGATVPKTAAIALPTTINSVSSVALPAEPIYSQSITVTASTGSFTSADRAMLTALYGLLSSSGGTQTLNTESTEMVANAVSEQADIAALIAAWVDGGRLDLILDAINAKSALITTGSVTVTSPVAADGTTITVVQGDDYSGSSAITWTGTSADQWPDLTDATLAFRATMMGAAPVVGVPTVTTPTGTQVFTLSLTDTQTATPVGRYRYDVEATLSGGAILTLLRGAFVVTRTYTNEP